jgi:hypothetical protein
MDERKRRGYLRDVSRITLHAEKICYTAKGNYLYGIYLANENEVLPKEIVLKGISVPETAIVTLLGIKGKCRWKTAADGIVIEVSAAARKTLLPPYAWTFGIML